MMATPILPGSVIGILGGGQLGRMLALAARSMGYRVHTISPDRDSPAGQVSDLEVVAAYYDHDQLRRFAAGVSVVTFEFENVPAETAAAAAEETLVRPDHSVLHTAQHRIREKTFLREKGIPVAPFQSVESLSQLEEAAFSVGYPAVLKTATSGYDGKGQSVISTDGDLERSWRTVGGKPSILEAFVSFEKEISVVVARGVEGEFAHYGAIENIHVNHILDVSISPARIAPSLAAQAVAMARAIAEALDLVGVLCVEMFVTRQGTLLVNELAPRPHNSGHLTVDGCVTSQFEQQLRAVCGLPLGSTELLQPTVMVNLLGDLWMEKEPDWSAALAFPGVKLHLYGKDAPRQGRKMGHLTVGHESVEKALETALVARESLTGSRGMQILEKP